MATTTRTRSKATTGAGKTDTNGHSPNPQYATLGQEVQAFDAMRDLPIGLKKKVRKESSDLLNKILADTTVLYALYKKHHWNVAGPTFYQLHLLFDKHAEEQLVLIDDIAERVQMLGGIAVGDPRHAAELTTIERAPDGAEDLPAEITRLLHAHQTIIGKVRDGIETTEESKDWGSNDLLMGDVLRRHEMQVWFLSEHLVNVPLVEDWADRSPASPIQPETVPPDPANVSLYDPAATYRRARRVSIHVRRALRALGGNWSVAMHASCESGRLGGPIGA